MFMHERTFSQQSPLKLKAEQNSSVQECDATAAKYQHQCSVHNNHSLQRNPCSNPSILNYFCTRKKRVNVHEEHQKFLHNCTY